MKTLSFFSYTLTTLFQDDNVGRIDSLMYGFLNHQLYRLRLKTNLFTVCENKVCVYYSATPI